MANLSGTNVAAAIMPFTTEDTYPTHVDLYGKGGFRVVATTAERDAIPAARRTAGMVVKVTADGKEYELNADLTTWKQWAPSGAAIAIDTALSTTSTNPVQNKVITTSLNNYETTLNATAAKAEAANNTANAAIPKANIDTVLPSTPLDSNVPSTKLLNSTIKSLEDADTLLGIGLSTATDTANAAIPKANIDTVIPENASTASDSRVPSTKVIANSFSSITNELVTIHDDINNATSTANNAIPKSKIDTSIDGNETDNTTVPGTGAIVSYIKTNNSGISTQLSNISSRVTTVENWKNGIGNKNVANGVAGLDAGGRISPSQLPAGYDNVDFLENFVTSNPTSGMTAGQMYYNSTTKKIFTATSATAGTESTPDGNDKVYINKTSNKSYRWTGSDMVSVGDGSGVALGITSSTAFRGDQGNTLYTNFGSGTNLTGTQDARDFFSKAKTYIPLESQYVIQNLAVNPQSDYVKIQDSILYLTGEPNSGDGFEISAANSTKAGVMTASMFNTLQEIELATFPLSLTASGGGTWEVGSSTTTGIAISVLRKGVNVTADSTIQVTASTGSGSLSSNKSTWTPSAPITSNTSVAVKATYGSQTATKTASYAFKYKKYWGTSASATLTNANILALTGNTWADSRAMNATNFDCTGGKYPYYVIPTSIASGLEWWVGGLKNTDVTSSVINLTNASGATESFTVFRLNNIQTGVLSIQFK